MKPTVALLLSLILVVCLPAESRTALVEQDDLQQALAGFIQAFDNLDWERFRSAFDDDRPGMRNRRTIVWRQNGTGWKIVHLHASEVKLPGN